MTGRRLFIGWTMLVLSSIGCRSAPQRASPTAPPDVAPPSSPEPPSPAAKPPSTPDARTAARPNAPAGATGAASSSSSFDFDADREGGPPAGFSFARTGGGAPGRWVVRAESNAPSTPHVLAQLDPDATDMRFPIAVAEKLSFRDLKLTARCKTISGRVDQACGLVFRYRDENNYYITRSNSLENNIRLYFVKDGKRRQLASHSGPVTPQAWHEYGVEVKGDHIQVLWDGKKVLDHHDGTFTDAGKVGFWTKADSVTYFDDLVVTPLTDRAAAPARAP
jgi:hypothetical protein